MAEENEIVAKFVADIEQYKKDVGEAAAVTGQLDKKVAETGATTQKFEKQTKGAAGSISTLRKGLGGVAGLLSLTGKLFGVNTDQIQELIFTSQQFSKIAKQLQDVQKASNLATKEGIIIKEADIIASEEQAAANTAALGPIGLLIGAAAAIGLAIYNVIGAKKQDKAATDEQTASIKELIKAVQDETEAQKIRRELLNGEESDVLGVAAAEKKLNEELTIEAKKIIEAADAQDELNKSRKGGLDDLQRELELLKVNTGQTETEKLRNARSVFTKEQEIRSEELKNLEERQKALGDFAFSDIELQQSIANKKNEIIVAQAAFETKAADRRFEELKQDAENTRSALSQELQFRIASLSGIDEEEKRIGIQSIKTRIELGVATKEEIDALAKYEIDAMKKVTDAQIADFKARQEAHDKFLAYRIASLTGHDKDEQKIALEAIKTRKKLGTATEAELDALDAYEKKINDKRIDSAKQVSDAIFKAQQEAFDKRQELLKEEQTAQEKAIDVQRDLAARGLENTLAFEQKRAAELQRQQQIDAQKQKRVKLLETFLNSLAEFSKTDPKTAISKALLQVALATAASAVFAEEGGVIGEIGSRSNLGRRHKGGGDVLLHAQTGEGVLPRDAMSAIGRRNFELLKNAGRHPIRDDVFGMPRIAMIGGSQVNNSELLKEVQGLRRDIKNQPRESFDINKWGEYTRTTIENGVTEVTKGKLKKPRFRA